MNKRQKFTIYTIFILVYVVLLTRAYLKGSFWFYDHLLAVVLMSAVYKGAKWLKLGRVSFILINLALLVHNLGAFDAYSLTYGMFGFDNLTHFFNSFVGAYVAFNFVAYKLHVRKNKQVRETVVDEHTAILIFLVFSTVAMLGTIVELVEFGGFFYLGSGDGMFFAGAGDGDALGSKDYIDTMTDIIVNTLGSLVGVLVYYHVRYKKRPWLRGK